MIFKNGKENIDLYNILCDINISRPSRDANYSDEDKRLWCQYILEMAIFYFDTLVDYLKALLHQATYFPEDVIVFNDVCGKLPLLLITLFRVLLSIAGSGVDCFKKGKHRNREQESLLFGWFSAERRALQRSEERLLYERDLGLRSDVPSVR